MATMTMNEGLTVKTTDGGAKVFSEKEVAEMAMLCWTLRLHRGKPGSGHLADAAIRLLVGRGMPVAAIEDAAAGRLTARELAEVEWAKGHYRVQA